MKFYALKTKGQIEFSFVSRTEKELDEKIEGAYWAGSKPTKEDFLAPFERVWFEVHLL